MFKTGAKVVEPGRVVLGITGCFSTGRFLFSVPVVYNLFYSHVFALFLLNLFPFPGPSFSEVRRAFYTFCTRLPTMETICLNINKSY